MHFAINRTTQAPISDINEFEDQQIEYAKHLQDEGTRYTYDMFQHQLMQRAHIDPELFHLRDKEKREIYRRIISHLKTELEFKRAEFDTIKHKDEVASYEQKRAMIKKISSKLAEMDPVFTWVAETLQFAQASAESRRKVTVRRIKSMCEKLNDIGNYLVSIYNVEDPDIHGMVKQNITTLNTLIQGVRRLIDDKVARGEVTENNVRAARAQLITIDTHKLSEIIPVSPHRSAGYDDDDDLIRQSHKQVKRLKRAADAAKEQTAAEAIFQ
jgi:uncharacterized protein YlxP (DUF503 family)